MMFFVFSCFCIWPTSH